MTHAIVLGIVMTFAMLLVAGNNPHRGRVALGIGLIWVAIAYTIFDLFVL